MTDPTLLDRPARDVVAALRAGRLSPTEALAAVEARVVDRDGPINALPTLCFDRARAAAARLEASPPEARGALAGLPIPIKDLTDVAGVRTTYGSPIFADHVPERSDALVARVEARGGVVYAKSNTPEFGAGASTFNEVFGVTRNPADLSRTVGGSSGGAAAALAGGMAWIAHGSDFGGSLRTPAAFCGVCGLRPTPGRVGAGPDGDPFTLWSVEGPMARDVADLGLALDALAGSAETAPIAFDSPPGAFFEAARRPIDRPRLLLVRDGGVTPLDPTVRAAFEAVVERLAASSVEIVERPLDLRPAWRAFRTLRALSFAVAFDALLATDRERLKPEIIANAEAGRALDAGAIVAATTDRAAAYAATMAAMEGVDAVLAPAAIVPPFPAEERYVRACDGVAFETYLDWLAIVCVWSALALPAMSLPAGRFADGAPFGAQLIGRPRGEAGLLSVAAALEARLATE